MPESVEVEVTQLPNVVVLAWAVTSMRITGTEGEEHPVVVLDLQVQLEPGKVGRQAFLLHKADAARIRADLKHPKPNKPQPPEQEETKQP